MDDGLAKRLYEGVRKAYSSAAERPSGEHPFPIGRAFAESVGYPKKLLESLPGASVDAFAGVSNVSIFAEIPEGSTVLDVGCGAGLDSLIAAGKVGPTGKVIGIDFSPSMLNRARQAVDEARLGNIEFHESPAEDLPVKYGEIDIAIVNGIFNLNPNRSAIFRQLAKAVRPGGRLYAAELILAKPITNSSPPTESEWFA